MEGLGYLVFLAASLAAVIGIMYGRERVLRQKQKIKDRAYDLLNRHKDVLLRKYRQKTLRDDYGNVILDAFLEEVVYFYDRVVEQEIRDDLARFLEREQRDLRREIVEGIVTTIVREYEAAVSLDSVKYSTPMEFETYCEQVLSELGWDAQRTPQTGDQGADIVAERNEKRMVVQCKWYSKPVGNKAVQEVVGAKGYYGAEVAVVVATNGFTKSAKALAQNNGVKLIHPDELDRIG